MGTMHNSSRKLSSSWWSHKTNFTTIRHKRCESERRKRFFCVNEDHQGGHVACMAFNIHLPKKCWTHFVIPIAKYNRSWLLMWFVQTLCIIWITQQRIQVAHQTLMVVSVYVGFSFESLSRCRLGPILMFLDVCHFCQITFVTTLSSHIDFWLFVVLSMNRWI